jgi:hypothetical protein
MKKLLLITASALSLVLNAQNNKTISFGWQWGFHGNQSEWSGGMQDANAKFVRNPFSGLNVSFMTRYDASDKWAFTGGIGLYTWGFDFSVRENYNIRREENKQSNVNVAFKTIELPFMAYRKFSLDCHNKRWMLGGGFAPTITGKKETTDFVDPGNEGANVKYLSADASSKGGGNICLRLAIAREKVYKNGSLLHAEFLVSLSPGVLGTATVRYTADGKEYDHQFTNRGNFAGFRLAFYCGKCAKKLGQGAQNN